MSVVWQKISNNQAFWTVSGWARDCAKFSQSTWKRFIEHIPYQMIHPLKTWRSRRIFDSLIPSAELYWHFFMGKVHQKQNNRYVFDQGTIGFPEEPGYYNAMMHTFTHIRDTLGSRMNAQSFLQLHDRCVDGVRYHKDPAVMGHRKGFHISSQYEIQLDQITPEARDEWARDKLIDPDPRDDRGNFLAVLYTPGSNTPRSQYGLLETHLLEWQTQEDIRRFRVCYPYDKQVERLGEKIDGIFNSYYERMSRAQTDDDKLRAISEHCRTLQIAHVFQDGNGRTICFALLNKLLMENGFSPAILECADHVFSGGYHTERMVVELKQGIKNARQLLDEAKHGKLKN